MNDNLKRQVDPRDYFEEMRDGTVRFTVHIKNEPENRRGKFDLGCRLLYEAYSSQLGKRSSTVYLERAKTEKLKKESLAPFRQALRLVERAANIPGAMHTQQFSKDQRKKESFCFSLARDLEKAILSGKTTNVESAIKLVRQRLDTFHLELRGRKESYSALDELFHLWSYREEIRKEKFFVRASDKICKKGAALHDPSEMNPLPIGAEPVEVVRTPFIAERLESGELIETDKSWTGKVRVPNMKLGPHDVTRAAWEKFAHPDR